MTELKYMYSMMQVRIDRSGECAYCDEIQILLVLDGKMTMNLNGKRMELLSDEIIIGAVKYAQIAREKGRMIPNSEVYGLLADRLGWK